MCCTNTGTTVLDGLVRDGELGEVVADHLGLDLDAVEDLDANQVSATWSVISI